MASEALTFKTVTVSSPDGLPTPASGEVVVQPGIGIVVFVHGEPRFVLRQEDGIDVFLGGSSSSHAAQRGGNGDASPSDSAAAAPTSSGSARDVSIVSGSGIVKLNFMTEANAKSFKQAIDRSRGDTRSMLRSSINAEAGMARAVTAMEAAARDDEYSRSGLANELNKRREQHRHLAQRFNSGSDADALLLRERFSTAAERSRQRLDQVETRHIERLESAILANKSLLGGGSGMDSGSSNTDRQRLWDAWAEAEAYRDNDMRRVGAANRRDNQGAAAWQEHQKKRQQIFDDIQTQLREIDHRQPGMYGSAATTTTATAGGGHYSPSPASGGGGGMEGASLLSPQSLQLVSQVKSLLNGHQSAVHDARDAGAARADAEIAEMRTMEADFVRREQERKAAEQAAIAAEMDRQLQEQREALARMKAQAEEEDRRRRQLMEEAKNTVRMHGDWKEMRNPGQQNYYVNVLTGRTTTDVSETPWKEPPKVVIPDPVLAQVKVPSSPAAAEKVAVVAKPADKPKPAEKPSSFDSASAAGPQPGDTNGDWKCHKHEASGKIYFVNKKENKTTWKIEESPWGGSAAAASPPASPITAAGSPAAPKAGDVLGDWKCHHHAASDKLYFVNKKENKTTWKIDESPWAGAGGGGAAASPPASPKTAAPAAPKAGDVLGDWKCHHHAASDKLYFVNKKENKTTWKIDESPWAGAGGAAAEKPKAAASPAAPKAGDVLGDWKCHHHAASDKLYFVNKKENKTTWKIDESPWGGSAAAASPAASPVVTAKAAPQPGEVRGDWKCHKQESSGKLYFVNKKENKTTWKAEETGGAF